jgi:hypothetical protein
LIYMGRLPQVGGDDGTWGQVLNDFLDTAHNADGSLKASSISSAGGQSTSDKGQPNGYAALDGSGKVPTSQLPTLVTSVNGRTSAVTLAAVDVGAYSTSQIDTMMRNTDAIILYNTGSSSYPVRSTVTSDNTRPVRWRGPVAPTIGGSYAVDNLDVWEQTP